jgi:hypothetical protein
MKMLICLIIFALLVISCISAPPDDRVATVVAQTVTALAVVEHLNTPEITSSSPTPEPNTPFTVNTPTPVTPTWDIHIYQTMAALTQAALPTFDMNAHNTQVAETQAILILTPSATPTASPTPINLYAFQSLINWDDLRTNPGGYSGQLVRAFTQPADDLVTDGYFMFPPDYGPRGVYCYLIADQTADNTVQKFKTLEWMWIYAKIIDPKNGKPQLSVYHVEEIPAMEQPKSDGLYQVNVDISPGQWKSGLELTDTDSCYWERNDSNGNIIDNYFGIGGITMWVGSGDTVIQFDGCGYMFYLGQ